MVGDVTAPTESRFPVTNTSPANVIFIREYADVMPIANTITKNTKNGVLVTNNFQIPNFIWREIT